MTNTIGKKLKEHAAFIAQKVIDRECNSIRMICADTYKNFIVSIIQCIGDVIGLEEGPALKQMEEWANDAQNRYNPVNDRLPVFPSHYLLDEVILEFFEEHIQHEPISVTRLIKDVQKVNRYLYHASTFFLPCEQENIFADGRITLQELNELVKALREATILTITDQNDNITYANDKYCRITQYRREELIGKNHHDLVYSGYHEQEFYDGIWNAIQEGRIWNGEICNKAKDGTLYWVDTTIIPFLNNKGVTYQHIAIQHDITEKKETEAMLQKTEKLSIVGELAAGFAHEIRNPLTTIKGFVQILDSVSMEKKQLYLKTILEEIDRINSIVSEFMVLARPQAVQFKSCSVSGIIRKVIQFLSAEATLKNVRIRHSFLSDNIFIYGEENQLTQVFINILKNALDAMPVGGEVHISCEMQDNETTILVEDNGIGMTDEQLKRIGEPFYTTKAEGNGLGLMVSYKIIHNHHGRINVVSEVNKGTTFLVTFPLITGNEQRYKTRNQPKI